MSVSGRDRVDGLQRIPDECELIYSSHVQGEIGVLGLPSVELYAMDASGGHNARLTWNGWTHNHFAVSPDRRYVACNRYEADSNGDGRLDFRDKKTLWILDLWAREEWMLVPELDAGWGGIDWSPDGEFVYASMSEPGRIATTDIHRIRPDGTGLQRLTEGIEKQLWPGADGKVVTDCGISTDSESMCFLFAPCIDGRALPKSRVAVAHLDGTDARFVTDGGPLEPGQRGPWGAGDFDPEFNPQGTDIVFSRATDVAFNRGNLSSYDIMRVPISGGDPVRLTLDGDPALKGIPDWSDDDRICFFEIDDRDGYIGPAIVNADGTDLHRVPGIIGTHFRWIDPPRG